MDSSQLMSCSYPYSSYNLLAQRLIFYGFMQIAKARDAPASKVINIPRPKSIKHLCNSNAKKSRHHFCMLRIWNKYEKWIHLNSITLLDIHSQANWF